MVGGGFPRRSVTKSSPRGGLFPGGGVIFLGVPPPPPRGGGFPRKYTPGEDNLGHRGGGGGGRISWYTGPINNIKMDI